MKQKGKVTPSEVVKNVIIYAHSMGNLILAAAIKNGVCSLDKESVSWYDLMGPLRGSPAANMLDTVCGMLFLHWFYFYVLTLLCSNKM